MGWSMPSEFADKDMMLENYEWMHAMYKHFEAGARNLDSWRRI